MVHIDVEIGEVRLLVRAMHASNRLVESQSLRAEPKMQIEIRCTVPAKLDLMLELETIRSAIGARSVFRGREGVRFCAGRPGDDLRAAMPVINRLELQDCRNQCQRVCDLAAMLNISESAVSHQLRLLRSLRIVKFRREGKMAFYTLDDSHVTSLIKQGLDHTKEKGE